jgi:undecaprenyl-diphosphatase
MAQRIETAWLRRLLTTILVVIPFLVAYARFYRGMHHVTDIVIGMLNGIVCALLAWYWLRRRSQRAAGRTQPQGERTVV